MGFESMHGVDREVFLVHPYGSKLFRIKWGDEMMRIIMIGSTFTSY